MRTAATTTPAALALALILGACGGGDSEESSSSSGSASSEASGGGESSGGGLEGVALTVGSKEFTEQQLVGQMAVMVLEEAGADVTDQTGLNGTEIVREALVAGEVDMYWEYTGTGWIALLGNDQPVTGQEEQYEAVKEADLEANDVWWFAPTDVDNTFALARRADGAEVSTISELATYLEENPDTAICADTEFANRDDGLPGLGEAYGFQFGSVEEVTLGVLYTQIGSDTCPFGVVATTDGRIAANDLQVLEDDQQFFPSYQLAMTALTPTYEANAEALDEVIGGLAEVLDSDTMQTLNQRVDVDGEAPEDVARDFLVEEGLLEG